MTNELSRLAKQYAEAQKRSAEWASRTIAGAEDHQKMGAHVTKLTDAYDNLSNAYSVLAADLRELFR